MYLVLGDIQSMGRISEARNMTTSWCGDQIDVRRPKVSRSCVLITLHFKLVVVKSVKEGTDRQLTYVVFTTKALPEIAKTPSVLDALKLSPPYTETHAQPAYVLVLASSGTCTTAKKTLAKVIISAVAWTTVNLVGKNQVSHSYFVSLCLHCILCLV